MRLAVPRPRWQDRQRRDDRACWRVRIRALERRLRSQALGDADRTSTRPAMGFDAGRHEPEDAGIKVLHERVETNCGTGYGFLEIGL